MACIGSRDRTGFDRLCISIAEGDKALGRRYTFRPWAEWQSGYAAACKAVDAGSIPTSASIPFPRDHPVAIPQPGAVVIISAGYRTQPGSSPRILDSDPLRPGGEIGRRKGLKIPRLRSCGFKSRPGHQAHLNRLVGCGEGNEPHRHESARPSMRSAVPTTSSIGWAVSAVDYAPTEWGRKPRSDRRAISSTYSRRYISSHFQLKNQNFLIYLLPNSIRPIVTGKTRCFLRSVQPVEPKVDSK